MTGRTRALAGLLLAMSVAALSACQRHGFNAGDHVSFDTPEQAVNALVTAVEKQDLDALRRLLGPESEPLVSSGDPVADQQERDVFLENFRAWHGLAAGSRNDLVLQVGAEHWPMPIPLVRHEGRWYFDGAAGSDELLTRRIGRNELRAIEVMQGFVAAQEEYAAQSHDDATQGTYATKLRSSAGKRDGLYWPTNEGEAPSPAGPLLAAAADEGYSNGLVSNEPYHGYVFRMLYSQGPDANGGAIDYIVDGKLKNGFALLATPHAYGTSGIMTFIINQDGVVWQRDFGERTADLAKAIHQFNPDSAWTPLPPAE